MKQRSRQSGFTIIELVVVVVIVFILSALIALTANGVQAKNRNGDRQADIDALRLELERHYASVDKYPTLTNLNDKAWRVKNMPKLKNGTIEDPRWNKNVTDCTKDDLAALSNLPAPNCYSYQATSADGSPCDNASTPCIHYTLTATLEGGEKYVRSSLN